MVPRLVLARLEALLGAFPAVALLGARQTGKTTLARSLPGSYFDLEREQDRLRLDVLWESLVSGRELVVLDEVQSAPGLMERLRGEIDADRGRNGRFLLLGSVAPELVRRAGESLTGRLGLCELSPLLVAELPEASHDTLWRLGGFPGFGATCAEKYRDGSTFYLDLMAQRDLPGWGLPARPVVTSRLFRMVAALHGQVWNASGLGRSLGLSYHTVNSYADFLEQAFLIRRLPAWSGNVGKRLTRSPKVYWRDTGLLHALLGWAPDQDLLDQPWVGASWEGFVVNQILDHLSAVGSRPGAFFLRSHDQKEVDLLLDLEGRRVAIEVKLTSQPSDRHLESLRAAADLVGADRAILVSRTRETVENARLASTNLAGVLLELGVGARGRAAGPSLTSRATTA